ncbi:MAG: hypothetical protein ACREPQ_14550 [Rhodanobacter sp.]
MLLQVSPETAAWFASGGNTAVGNSTYQAGFVLVMMMVVVLFWGVSICNVIKKAKDSAARKQAQLAAKAESTKAKEKSTDPLPQDLPIKVRGTVPQPITKGAAGASMASPLQPLPKDLPRNVKLRANIP